MSLSIFRQAFFSPSISSNRAIAESLYYRQVLCGVAYLQYTVEASVAYNLGAVDAYALKKLLALLVLHEELGDTMQHTGVLLAIPTEEDLVRSEYARHAVDRHSTMLQYVEIVVPELILNEESHNGTHGTQESS